MDVRATLNDEELERIVLEGRSEHAQFIEGLIVNAERHGERAVAKARCLTMEQVWIL